MLQVLLHTAIDGLYVSDDTVLAKALLSDYRSPTQDLCHMLLEFLSPRIVLPWRDIFEKATGVAVTQSPNCSFLTEAEAEVAMSTSK